MIFDSLDNLHKYSYIGENFDNIFGKTMELLKGNSLPIGITKLSEDIYINISQYQTKNFDECLFEAHRNFIDVQILLEGEELFYLSPINKLAEVVTYSAEKDCTLYSGSPQCTCDLTSGHFIICLPEDGHMPNVSKKEFGLCKKAILKIKVDYLKSNSHLLKRDIDI